MCTSHASVRRKPSLCAPPLFAHTRESFDMINNNNNNIIKRVNILRGARRKRWPPRRDTSGSTWTMPYKYIRARSSKITSTHRRRRRQSVIARLLSLAEYFNIAISGTRIAILLFFFLQNIRTLSFFHASFNIDYYHCGVITVTPVILVYLRLKFVTFPSLYVSLCMSLVFPMRFDYSCVEIICHFIEFRTQHVHNII